MRGRVILKKKHHFKPKLVVNSQTIRRLQPAMLQGVQGGVPNSQCTNTATPTDYCSDCCA